MGTMSSPLLPCHSHLDDLAYPCAGGRARAMARVVKDRGGQPRVKPGHRGLGQLALMAGPLPRLHVRGNVMGVVVLGRLGQLILIAHYAYLAFLL
jgi:hypothetical protein